MHFITTGRLLLTALVIVPLLAATPARAECSCSVPIRDQDHAFGRGVCSWKSLKEQNIVMQRRDYSCGAAVLATIARYYWGDEVGEKFFLDALIEMLTEEEMKDRVINGLAISDLRRVAVKQGYQSTIGTLGWDKLSESRVPLVVPIKTSGHDHFVVYRGHDGEKVYIADPIRGNLRVPIATFLEEWQKNAILVLAKPGEKVRDYSPLSIRGDEISLGELNWQVIRTRPHNTR